MLHNDEFSISHTQASESLGIPPAQSVTARHGDIKPANILWFITKEGIVLKLSDFGLTRFHREVSQFRMYDRLVGSRTYRAPECDLKQPISPMYDMWSLGCVFLEFLSWYMLGFEEGVDDFAVQRVKDDTTPHVRQDSFFNAVMTETGAKFGAYLKASVIRVS
jgi:serine/threonine protein kinase